ncbi:endoplasmic reticulum metallopeptidase 1-like [Asbolus verrucosus]|uniref:FXNA-like protease n=1 Tax=Asbolus verrucosus TaxID=1661398 RepID=A0A482WDK8_ASBVE|nr:endoplasmic reticulum metallopeptidase 1-like [Asbolus verrucosus]
MRRRADFVMDDNAEDTINLDGSRKVRNSIHMVPAVVSFGFIAVLLGLYGIVYTIDANLPTPLYRADEEAHPEAFITERARHDLKLLTDLGPRVAGGDTSEILAVDILRREINFIIQNAHKNQKIELDMHLVTGSHYLNMTPYGKIVAYSNLQNIVVKLYADNNATQALLVNAHFDSVPTSPGGSDDGINCAVMLEVLRKLSREPQRPLNNIIFLFNGAEETGLQAAHGFITKHKWAKDCKVVLNLEAAGAGGKIILFQSGPSAPWLMNYYNNVPHPYGQAAGEEIFQSNVVPSDTDFRIFRDYGGLYDDFEHIPLGSFQHVGDNTLSLVRDLANAPEVANPKEDPGKVIFFDFLGLFMITYSQAVAQALNYVAVLLSLGIFALSMHSFKLGYTKQTLKYLTLTFGAIIAGWVAAAVFVLVVALIVDKIGYSMSWYRNPWLIFGLYAAPTVAVSSLVLVIPTTFLMYTSLITLSLFVPITGRIGPDKNADLIIGMLSLFFTILITSPFVALVTLVRNSKFLIVFLGVTFAVSFIIIFTPLGFPYSGNKDSPAAERYWILHSRRVFHNEEGAEVKRDSGYFLLNMDRNSPDKVRRHVKDLARAKTLEEDCKSYILCGLPLVHVKMIQIIKYSSWIPAGQPLIPEPARLEVLSKNHTSPTVVRYDVSITGPDRMGLYLSPKRGVKVLNISLMDRMPPEGDKAVWNERDLYFILHIYGKQAAPLRFSFDVEVPANSSGVTTEIAVSGIYVHDEINRKVPHYVQFLNEFPDWVDLTAWLGSYESWWL